MERFIAQVQRIGCALVGQTGDFAPVDKRLYALRDVTATVESLPLIVSSILSKKLAAGCDAMVLDVKTGDGAFMRTLAGSKRLAEEMVKIAGLAGQAGRGAGYGHGPAPGQLHRQRPGGAGGGGDPAGPAPRTRPGAMPNGGGLHGGVGPRAGGGAAAAWPRRPWTAGPGPTSCAS